MVEIIEEFFEGVLISRKISGKEVPIPEMEKNFIQFNKINRCPWLGGEED